MAVQTLIRWNGELLFQVARCRFEISFSARGAHLLINVLLGRQVIEMCLTQAATYFINMKVYVVVVIVT